MLAKTGRLQQAVVSLSLFTLACLLLTRLLYIYLGNTERYPINTIKMIASYEHISHQQLENILASYLTKSFFTLPVNQLYHTLTQLPWAEEIDIERIWPDTLKIVLKEKRPLATWNDVILTTQGDIIADQTAAAESHSLPHLSGPPQDLTDVLQMYKKMSKILSIYGLSVGTLERRQNHAWEMTLKNGIVLKLGKQDIPERLTRFCKAFPTVFAEKAEQLVSVDLRYPEGMAVKWQPAAVENAYLNQSREDNGKKS